MGGLLSLAFAAGMVAPVNPCGFALLPAWISQTLGDADASPVPVRLLRALRSGIALAIGFAGTLAAAGLLVSAGARGLIQAAPKLGLAVGVLLVLLGLWMLAGRSISVRLPRITGRATEGLPPTARMLVFGIGYALASLSCTFGVILAVIAQAQATASYAGLLLVFGVYAAGSASILLLLALATTAAGTGNPPRRTPRELWPPDHRRRLAAHRRLPRVVLVARRHRRQQPRRDRPCRRCRQALNDPVRLGSGSHGADRGARGHLPPRSTRPWRRP